MIHIANIDRIPAPINMNHLTDTGLVLSSLVAAHRSVGVSAKIISLKPFSIVCAVMLLIPDLCINVYKKAMLSGSFKGNFLFDGVANLCLTVGFKKIQEMYV